MKLISKTSGVSRSNTRSCSDTFQLRCWDGGRIGVVGTLQASDVKHTLALLAYRSRLQAAKKPPRTPIEWRTDNGGIFVRNETQDFAVGLGFIPCQTPAYSPENNDMSEALVKRFKQDYVYVNDLWDAEEVLAAIPTWGTDYNENHPNKALKMMTPRLSSDWVT